MYIRVLYCCTSEERGSGSKTKMKVDGIGEPIAEYVPMYPRQPAVRRVIAWQTRGVDSPGKRCVKFSRNGIVYLSLERR
jgi:hypothetical protein